MPVTAKQLLEAANAAVPKISGKEAQELVAKGALLVDVRDGTEVAATGAAPPACVRPPAWLPPPGCTPPPGCAPSPDGALPPV